MDREAWIEVIESDAAGLLSRSEYTLVHRLDDVATSFPLLRGVGVLDVHQRFSLSHRVGYLGPITVLDLSVGVDTWIHCGQQRSYYAINVPIKGQIELLHRNMSITARPGRGAIYLPEGELTVPRWAGGGRTIALRIDRNVLEDALTDAVGRQILSQIEFKPTILTSAGAGRSWMQMLLMLNHELSRADTALTQPLIAQPFLDTFIHTLLLAAEHPYREMLAADTRQVGPRSIRTAVQIIEAETHLPLTVSALAARSHVSARALQQGFQRHMRMSPMTYLRQVRLRRAHQDLLESDPSVETVASIALRWGFSNHGRFAAMHAERYGEPPAMTLRRSATAARGS
jgi:AraC-like DNA-binding protein